MRITRDLIIGFLILITFNSLANADINQLRTSLLNAIRSNYPYLDGTKFKVNKIEFFKNYAYMCGTAADQSGDAIKRDKLFEIYDTLMQIGLDGEWREVANFNSFSTREEPKCNLKDSIEDFLSKQYPPLDKCNELSVKNNIRNEILNTLRKDKNERFLTTRICASSKNAYYCGARENKNGLIQGTGEAIGVDDVILRKKPDGTWEEVVQLGLFATSLNSIKCHFGAPGVLLSESTLEKAIREFEND